MLPQAVLEPRVRLRTVFLTPMKGPSLPLGLLSFQDLDGLMLRALSPERFSTSHGSEERTRFPLEPSYVPDSKSQLAFRIPR